MIICSDEGSASTIRFSVLRLRLEHFLVVVLLCPLAITLLPESALGYGAVNKKSQHPALISTSSYSSLELKLSP